MYNPNAVDAAVLAVDYFSLSGPSDRGPSQFNTVPSMGAMWGFYAVFFLTQP